jgi:arylamine N-acetyltransferase
MLENPECPFRLKRMVNLRTPQGSRNILDSTFSRSEGGEKTEREFREEELPEILCSYFGIEYK